MNLKYFSRYWHSLKKNYVQPPPDASYLMDLYIYIYIYIYIPTQLRKLIMNSKHCSHLGHSGMIHLANLVWSPRIHRQIVTVTQNCTPCIKIGKNLKPIIPKMEHHSYRHYTNQSKKSKWTLQDQYRTNT